MAQKIKTFLVDDLTGEPVEETVQFALDGRHYELDRTKGHAPDRSRDERCPTC